MSIHVLLFKPYALTFPSKILSTLSLYAQSSQFSHPTLGIQTLFSTFSPPDGKLGVSSEVGDDVGLSVGEGVAVVSGEGVGVDVDEEAGLSVGLAVGLEVGEPAGLDVGLELGEDVGEALGDSLV